jgi:hypothetical protein
MSRSLKSAKAAGSAFESQISNALAWHLKSDHIERRVTNGARDRGDIGGVRSRDGQRVVVECKNQARINLAGWVTEAKFEAINDNALMGFVVHKRVGTADPLQQYVTMTLGDLLLLAWGVDPKKGSGQA